MAGKSTRKRAEAVSRLDQEPYASMLARTRDKTCRALERYGDPKLSLDELRAATAAMKVSLSEALLAERRAGW